MNAYFLNKLGTAISESFHLFHCVSSPRLIMTLLVKNEEFMLEQNLLFHKLMGVDHFIVTDNNSTDATMDILKKYQRKGWILDIIEEKAENYNQKVWVDRMIWKAKTEYHADWIINADADELWYAPSGNFKNELAKARGNVQNCIVTSVYPEEGKPFWEWCHVVGYVSNPDEYDLSIFSIFERQNKKVIHRTKGYLQISMGNHKVSMFPKISQRSEIRVYHYNVRGRQAFIDKMVNGGKQLEERNQKHGGRHWKYFYELHKEDKLHDEYDRVIGANSFDRLCNDGHVYVDTTIKDFFIKVMNHG